MATVRRVAPFFVIVLAYAGLRLMHLDHGFHIDEPHWVGRSLNFYRALRNGEFEYTFQREHPGVMTMWAGAIAYWIRFPEVAGLAGENLERHYRVASDLREWGIDPLSVIVALRASKVIMQAVFFAISTWYLIQLLGRKLAMLIGALMALSPTLMSLDSLMHIDGVNGITMLSAICAIAYAAENTFLEKTGTNRVITLWILAGILAATSWLSRSTSVVLVGAAGLALLMQVLARYQHRGGNGIVLRQLVSRACRLFGIWIIGAVIGTFTLFPALWVDPIHVISQIIGIPISALMGNESTDFFSAESTSKAWSFFPLIIARSTSPFEWFGVAVVVLFGWYAVRRGIVDGKRLRLATMMLAVIIVAVLGNGMSPIQYPRYVFMAYPLIMIMAAIGWSTLVGLLNNVLRAKSQTVAWSLAGLVVAYSMVGMLNGLPYRVAYSNPIYFAVTGSGESNSLYGQDQVQEFITEQASRRDLTVSFRSQYPLYEFFFGDPPVSKKNFRMTTPSQWYMADYDVIPGGPAPGDVYDGYTPVKSIYVDGILQYSIFATNQLPLPGALAAPSACTWDIGNHATLLQVVRSRLSIDLYFLMNNVEGLSVSVEGLGSDGPVPLGTYDLAVPKAGMVGRVSVPLYKADTSVLGSNFWFRINITDEEGTSIPATRYRDAFQVQWAQVSTSCYKSQPPNLSPELLADIRLEGKPAQ